MPMHKTGRNLLAALILGESVTPLFTTTGSCMWVGSGTNDHNAADNHLGQPGVAATMLSGYPIRAVNVMTFRGLYATNIANFNWQEWGIKNATSSATSTAGNVAMFQRKQEDLGTKTNSQQWQLTVDVSLTT
jgi:hypothetical protein